MERLKEERLQEYMKRLENLREILRSCESEAEECLALAPTEACRSMMRDLLHSLRTGGQSVVESIEYWRYQLEEG
ncbi:MAG: hypothetical protein N2648_02625 [Aquificaceae bacterium]|nr:hypothetical protein [Aquificaceae bacterium]MCS7196516.1 hypothetical protein [Aquificaceae bacterium]MCX7989521.1 hypothetical protein [Aquificaceae bacterium]MDW8294493.1 hypothetical protein [Aquificaceae bacterium]